MPKYSILFEPDHSGKPPKDSLRILTNGHQYFRQHLKKPKPDTFLTIKPLGFVTICDRIDVQLGKVVAIHCVRSDTCPLPDLSLKLLLKKRLAVRADPNGITDLASYFHLRKSCWIIEETSDGLFYCDCPVGFKGKNCKHELACGYKMERIEVLPQAAALPLGGRRPKGRPRAITMNRPKETDFSAISGTLREEGEIEVLNGPDDTSEELHNHVNISTATVMETSEQNSEGNLISILDKLLNCLGGALNSQNL